MIAQELLLDLTGRGIQFEVSKDKLRFGPKKKLSDRDLAALKEHKADIVALLSTAKSCEGCSADDNEFYWTNLQQQDLAYLTAPRPEVVPCSWCGGRTRHNPLCDQLRADWEITIPFGQYKGHKVSEVPRTYLRWLVGHSTSLTDDLCTSIQERLNYRSNST